MRLRLTTNAAGDIRLQCLRDKKRSHKILPPQGGNLVYSNKLQEMTTSAAAQPKVGFGGISKGTTFGRAASQFLREAGAAIDKGDRKKTVFLTGTLPGSTPAAVAALAAYSGWVVQTVAQWVHDYAPGALYFGVWEWQARGALHLHICVQSAAQADAAQLLARWRQRWLLILDGIARKSSVDVYQKNDHWTWKNAKQYVKVDAQIVQNSVACYLSKYLSKASQTSRRQSWACPSRWWFCSANLRQLVRDSRQQIEVLRLPLTTAIGLYEKIQVELGRVTAKTFAYQSPYDYQTKGTISLLSPVVAAVVFKFISQDLRLVDLLGYGARKPLPIPSSGTVRYFDY